jgi:hypothetical protein
VVPVMRCSRRTLPTAPQAGQRGGTVGSVMGRELPQRINGDSPVQLALHIEWARGSGVGAARAESVQSQDLGGAHSGEAVAT